MASIALTIAGSDSAGGAGIQADLKAFAAQGVYGASVITVVTAQNTHSVTAVYPVITDVIEAQIEAVLSDLDVKAIKIGMLGMPDVIQCVSKRMSTYPGPIVLDPVMVSKSGATLLPEEAIDTLRTSLIPQATLLTPNIPEAAVLLDTAKANCDSEFKAQGKKLLSMGARAVLMKAGHQSGEFCTDWLITRDSEVALSAPRVDTKNTHGTGCSYSAAIAAGLAKGQTLEEATRAAHKWLHQAIVEADKLQIGHGHGPVHHFHRVWK